MSVSPGQIDRREFLVRACAAGASVCLGAHAAPAWAAVREREARYYRSLPGNRVHCYLCPCNPTMEACGVLSDGQTCFCRVRTNRGGRLYVSNYGRAAAVHNDPVEKSPLYHVLPGAKVLAVAAPGCNLTCKCCQNWGMSQAGVEDLHTIDASPEELVRRAIETGCRGLAFTYTEPIVYFEYLVDTAALARKRGLRCFVSTGGYITTDPLIELCRYVDAFSVSVKGFSEKFYLEQCRGSLSTVLDCLKTIHEQGVWLEIPVLIIPTLSDNIDEVSWFCTWVNKNLGAEVPVHFVRFSPAFRLQNLPATTVPVLEAARSTALRCGSQHVYIGNVPGHDANNTTCPSCKRLLIQRIGVRLLQQQLTISESGAAACPGCGRDIPGSWA